MAHASKATRQTRRKKQFATKGQVLGLQRKNVEMIGMAIEAHDKAAHLARVLTYLVAVNGGAIRLPKAGLTSLPATARLQEMYEKETDTFAFICTTDDAPAEQPKIEVVQPKIEVVSA